MRQRDIDHRLFLTIPVTIGCLPFLCLASVGTVHSVDDSLLRTTTSGKVRGYVDEEHGVWAWKGVPFAKPPVGDLRWRAPQDAEPWQGERLATEDPPPCIQPTFSGVFEVQPETKGDEDCLYLNVFRPQSSEANLPVLFWIHGGGNVFGSAGDCCVENLARKANIVIVVVQYRLGVLGFFTHPALRADSNDIEDSGNFGLLDQIKALRWTKQNIASFGGNPFNVTIGGHSAGGHDVAQLTICPLASGLFHRALDQSGGWLAQSRSSIDETATRTITYALMSDDKVNDPLEAERLVQKMPSSRIACMLRSVPAKELLHAHNCHTDNSFPVWAFVIEDGVVIPGPLFRVIESGRYARVPTTSTPDASACTRTMYMSVHSTGDGNQKM